MVIYCVVSLIRRLRELISWCILKPRCHPSRMLTSSSPDGHGVYLFSIAWRGRWSKLIKVIWTFSILSSRNQVVIFPCDVLLSRYLVFFLIYISYILKFNLINMILWKILNFPLLNKTWKYLKCKVIPTSRVFFTRLITEIFMGFVLLTFGIF